jgi:serine/threonine-protein kinase RsbW
MAPFLSYPAKLESLPLMMQWVQKQLEKTSLTSQAKLKVELALEEAIVNIIHYAYPDKAGEVELACETNTEGIQFILRDRGVPFNPLHQQSPDLKSSIEERKVGGLGIYLMRQNMDKVSYERQGTYNVLVLLKKFL